MSIWSSERVQQRAKAEKLISPFAPTRVCHGAYELSLGAEAFVTSKPGASKQRLNPAKHVTIPPGQFSLLHTAEIVRMPADAMGFISIKAGVKLRGLVNISGFHVDPGYEGQLVFSVHNAGAHPVRLGAGEPAFLLWFCALTSTTTDLYHGAHRNQCGISAKAITDIDGEIVSTQTLREQLQQLERIHDERLKDLERSSGFQEKLIWGLLITLVVGVGLVLFDRSLDKTVTSNSPATTGTQPKP